MDVSRFISELSSRIEIFKNENLNSINENEGILNTIDSAASYFDKYCEGSWIINKASTYFHDDGSNYEMTISDVEKYIQRKHRTPPLIEIQEIITPIFNEIEDIFELVVTYSVIFETDDQFDSIRPLLKEIKDIKWQISPQSFLKALQPSNLIVGYDDLDALSTGRLQAPPHIAYQSRIYSLKSKLNAIREFIKLTERFTKQVNLLIVPSEKGETIDAIEFLLNKIHEVALKLTQRHEKRPTLIISDEYDVQDLLFSLLWIYFEDVRLEEHTPSFAGGSARMDILVKDNNSVIEVKKTRKGLSDKELGKQLIEDIAFYKKHENCKKLYCFIYDPDFLIRNRKGLCSDIESTNDLDVTVIINP